jgi:hypothetical protein
VDSGADKIGPYPERLLHRFAEHEARRIARNARHRHQMLHADPYQGFVDPDDHAPGQPADQTGADDCCPI